MFFRVVKNIAQMEIPAATTSRAPSNVPYLIDNLWEWLRPSGFPSRRTAAFASPTVALAAASANGLAADAWGVEFLDGQTAVQITNGRKPEDARYHEDIRRLTRLIVRDWLGTSWSGLPANNRGPEAILFLPCATKTEIGEAIAASKLLNAEMVRENSTFWSDVTTFEGAESAPHPSGEIFFGGAYRLVPLNL